MALKFSEYSSGQAEKEFASSKSSGSGSFISLKEGSNKFRILPPAPGSGMKSPFKVMYQHWITVDGNRTSFTCPRIQHRSECPVCALIDKLARSDYPRDRKQAKDYEPSRTVYVNVINRAQPELGPQVLRLPKTVHEALTKIRKDPDIGGDFSHPLHGCDIKIDREGTTMENTSYPLIQQIPRSSPLAVTEAGEPDEVQMQLWIDGQKNLEDHAKLLTPEEIEEKVKLDAATPKSRRDKQAAPPAATKKLQQPNVQDDIEDAEFEEG